MRTLEAKILDSTHLELVEPITLRPGRRIEVSIRIDDDDAQVTAKDDQPEAAASREPEPGLSGPRRHRELEWRRSHRDLLQTYAGQWVVLEDDEIVAHGKSMAQPVEQARAQGIRVPYVFYVEESQPDVVNIGL